MPEIEKEELSLLLRRAARTYLGLTDGEHWPSGVADAQADALIAADVVLRPGQPGAPA